MQTANILLSLGGDAGTTVPKYGVTASEIAVLRAIHGPDAVRDIEPIGNVERSDRDEMRRLHEIYDRAGVKPQEQVVSEIFPGAGAAAIKRLDDLDLPEEFYKAERRMKPTASDEPEAPKAKRGRKAKSDEPEAPIDEGDQAEDMADAPADKVFE